MRLIVAVCLLFFSSTLLAHGGGTDKNGCHYNKKTHNEHCHDSQKTKKKALLRASGISSLMPGSGRSVLISNIQKQLVTLGYQADTETGVAGPRTIMAIRLYQQSHNLLETGQVSPELLEHLIGQN